MSWLTSGRAWYEEGLAFECAHCGRCCSGPEEGYVWISPEEIAAAAAHLGTTVEQFTAAYTHLVSRRVSLIEQPNRDCIFLVAAGDGERHCRIYSVRPTQCRTWPFWPQNLGGPSAWARAGERCPGINRGRRHEAQHIDHEKDRTR